MLLAIVSSSPIQVSTLPILLSLNPVLISTWSWMVSLIPRAKWLTSFVAAVAMSAAESVATADSEDGTSKLVIVTLISE